MDEYILRDKLVQHVMTRLLGTGLSLYLSHSAKEVSLYMSHSKESTRSRPWQCDTPLQTAFLAVLAGMSDRLVI